MAKEKDGNNKGLSAAIEKHVRSTRNFGATEATTLDALEKHLVKQGYSLEVRSLILSHDKLLTIRKHHQNGKPGRKLNLHPDFRKTISSLTLPCDG